MNRDSRLLDASTHWSVNAFLLRDAELLDEWRYAEWAELLTEDFSYRIPVPVTRDDPTQTNYSETAFLVEETRASLDLWFRRHDEGFHKWAWGENPRQRTRRFVSNVRVRANGDAASVSVRANEILSFARQSDPAVLTSCLREDVLERADTDLGWKLAERVVYLDQNVHSIAHMRIIF
jgi:phthalate 3,4-dioxygenase beta subunit